MGMLERVFGDWMSFLTSKPAIKMIAFLFVGLLSMEQIIVGLTILGHTRRIGNKGLIAPRNVNSAWDRMGIEAIGGDRMGWSSSCGEGEKEDSVRKCMYIEVEGATSRKNEWP